MRSTAIAVSGLRKAYGDKVVLDGIDFQVATGSVFSLLGPNGAGKTTTVNILTTLLTADAGTVAVAGHDVATATRQVRAAIGVTGQFAAVDELLTGRENLRLMADLKRVRDGGQVVTRLLERFDLVESADKPASTYSGGMRRKLDLAMTLVGDPQIIFLDEPSTGLDPRSRRTMWGIVRALVAQGTADELKRQIPGTHVRLRFTDAFELDAAARVFAEATRDDEELTLRVPSDGESRSLRALLDRLDEHGLSAQEFSVHTPDLDDVFLTLTENTSEQKEAVAR